jgi:hypothetical protein
MHVLIKTILTCHFDFIIGIKGTHVDIRITDHDS